MFAVAGGSNDGTSGLGSADASLAATRVERAAAVLGRNVTEFSVQALTERAEEVLSERRIFGVDQAQWAEFVCRLDEPARPVKKLVDF